MPGVNFPKLRKNDKFELDMMMLIKVTMVIVVTNFLFTLQLFSYLGDVGHFMKMFKSFASFLFQHFVIDFLPVIFFIILRYHQLK